MKHNKNIIKNKRGFTLVEVILVVAVIAILLGILGSSLLFGKINESSSAACYMTRTELLNSYLLVQNLHPNEYTLTDMFARNYSGPSAEDFHNAVCPSDGEFSAVKNSEGNWIIHCSAHDDDVELPKGADSGYYFEGVEGGLEGNEGTVPEIPGSGDGTSGEIDPVKPIEDLNTGVIPPKEQPDVDLPDGPTPPIEGEDGESDIEVDEEDKEPPKPEDDIPEDEITVGDVTYKIKDNNYLKWSEIYYSTNIANSFSKGEIVYDWKTGDFYIFQRDGIFFGEWAAGERPRDVEQLNVNQDKAWGWISKTPAVKINLDDIIPISDYKSKYEKSTNLLPIGTVVLGADGSAYVMFAYGSTSALFGKTCNPPAPPNSSYWRKVELEIIQNP